jgi:hypothetical protein
MEHENWHAVGTGVDTESFGTFNYVEQKSDSGLHGYSVTPATGGATFWSESLSDIAFNYDLSKSIQAAQGMSGGGYADGGFFGGGVRLVGERGPEIEVTGPSRIFDAQTTASMLRSGGASNDEVVQELRLVRAALERNNEYASSSADSLKGRNQQAPLRVQVVTSA